MALSSSAWARAGDVLQGCGKSVSEGSAPWGGEEKHQQQQHQHHVAHESPLVACPQHGASSLGLGLGFGAGYLGFDAPWLIEILLHRRRNSVVAEGPVDDGETGGAVVEKATRPATILAPADLAEVGGSGTLASTPLLQRQGDASTIYDVRLATEADIPLLGDIERSAGEVFRQVGLEAVADDEPMPEEVLRGYANAGQVWVAVADRNVVVGFLACFPIAQQDTRQAWGRGEHGPDVDAFLHIAELSVHSAHQKRGLGRRLLETMFAEVQARPRVLATGFTGDERWQRGARVLIRGFSLTTYRHLAFNKAFYERMGFSEVAVGDIEGLVGRRGRELWEEEQAGILRPEMRCWMVRDLGGKD